MDDFRMLFYTSHTKSFVCTLTNTILVNRFFLSIKALNLISIKTTR